MFEQFLNAVDMIPVVVGNQYGARMEPLIVQYLQHRAGLSGIDNRDGVGFLDKPDVVIL